jgi:large subunit ribosomal protein L33
VAKKSVREKVKMVCSSCKNSGLPGVNVYMTYKNRRNTEGKLELKKYCKFERKHTLHKEAK